MNLFKDKYRNENSYRPLTGARYTSDEINVEMSGKTDKKYYGESTTLETEIGRKSTEGAAIGGH